jgi:uncharacterized protein with PQ loop repeat
MAQVLYYRQFYKPQHHDEVVESIADSCESSISGLSDHANQSRQFLDENSPLLAQAKSGCSYQRVSLQTRRVVRIFTLLSILMWIVVLIESAHFFFWSGREIDLTHWHLVPQLLGWGSAVLYCVSRIPQIMQNFRNESVEGLSLTMFVFSVVGNVTYCLVSFGQIVNSVNRKKLKIIYRALFYFRLILPFYLSTFLGFLVQAEHSFSISP